MYEIHKMLRVQRKDYMATLFISLQFYMPLSITVVVIEFSSVKNLYFFYHGTTAPQWAILEDSRSHSVRISTIGRTPMDEWSTRRRDLYPTKHNTHNRQTFMPPARFEPKIPASDRPQTHTLDRADTEIGEEVITKLKTLYRPKSNMSYITPKVSHRRHVSNCCILTYKQYFVYNGPVCSRLPPYQIYPPPPI